MSENECSVWLGNEHRELRYTVRSLCFLEKALGRSFKLDDIRTWGGLILMIQAGCQHLERAQQPQEHHVADWLDHLARKPEPETDREETHSSLLSKILKAWAGGLPIYVPKRDGTADPQTAPKG